MNAMHRVALVAALILGCSSDAGSGPSCGSGGTATSVNVCDNFFAPASSPITTSAGITWTWRGGDQHNVTFEDPGFTNSATKTSGTHTQSFASAGTFRYRCTIHSSNFASGMVGSVTVQ
jgi:plastocyanin